MIHHYNSHGFHGKGKTVVMDGPGHYDVYIDGQKAVRHGSLDYGRSVYTVYGSTGPGTVTVNGQNFQYSGNGISYGLGRPTGMANTAGANPTTGQRTGTPLANLPPAPQMSGGGGSSGGLGALVGTAANIGAPYAAAYAAQHGTLAGMFGGGSAVGSIPATTGQMAALSYTGSMAPGAVAAGEFGATTGGAMSGALPWAGAAAAALAYMSYRNKRAEQKRQIRRGNSFEEVMAAREQQYGRNNPNVLNYYIPSYEGQMEALGGKSVRDLAREGVGYDAILGQLKSSGVGQHKRWQPKSIQETAPVSKTTKTEKPVVRTIKDVPTPKPAAGEPVQYKVRMAPVRRNPHTATLADRER